MRSLLLVVCLGLALLAAVPAHAGKSPPKIQLRVHVQTTGDGVSVNQAQPVFLPPNGEQILIRAMPEVSEHNLMAVDSLPSGTLLTFNHEGAVNLSAVTAQNQGRVLVVFINGFIVYSPVIDEQITNGQLLLPHQMRPEVIAALKTLAADNLRHSQAR